jgi:hypothetical protein
MTRPSALFAFLAGLSSCGIVAPHPDRPAVDARGEPLAGEGRRGVSREAGSTSVLVRGHYGVPILGESIRWDGNAEIDNFGVGAYLYTYVVDGLAIGGGINGTVFKNPGENAYGLEFEAAGRVHMFDIGDVGTFFDFTGGWLQTNDPVPPEGTEWNMTFSFGPGVDIPIGARTSLQIAAIYHHFSNALGRQNDRNPSQNEGRFWAGVAWNF